MRIKKFVSVLVCLLLVVLACSTFTACKEKEGPSDPFKVHAVHGLSSDSLYVKKVENLPDNFIMGMDISSLISLENAGVKYYNFAGEEEDLLKILADNGVNTVRVRVWNYPYDKAGNGFGGGNCDIDTAVAIGKRATQYGINLMVDFHYSDFWADPSRQTAPRAWQDMEIEEKAEALYQYTKESLQKLKDESIKVSIVQVGNETNGIFCGENVWFDMVDLFAAGSRAVREVLPKAMVAFHFANPEKITNYYEYAGKLATYDVDYDIFASSYYPYWHGSLDNLSSLLSDIAKKYNKKVMVAETSYATTLDDSDFGGNTIGEGASYVQPYPFSVQGQSNSVRDVIDTIAHTTNGIGVCYWEGAWITAGGATYEENLALWEKYGCGWATRFAANYDEEVEEGKSGGTVVDNEAFFDATGHPYESLKIFSLAHDGNVVENKIEAYDDCQLQCDFQETLVMPTTVNAVMLDNSRVPVNVTWNLTQSDIDKMYAGQPNKKYTISGTTETDVVVKCIVTMVEKNYLTNYSFEEDGNMSTTAKGWTIIDRGNAEEIYIMENVQNATTGNMSFHFWNKPSVDLDLEQDVTGLNAGYYKFGLNIQGGDGGTTNIYLYVKIDGKVVATQKANIYAWGTWKTYWINDIEYDGTSEFVVGIHIECSGTGRGAWGNVDDMMLNAIEAPEQEEVPEE